MSNDKVAATFHPATAQERASELWAEQEAEYARRLVAEAVEQERICVECGNDTVCEGYDYCSECLELLFP